MKIQTVVMVMALSAVVATAATPTEKEFYDLRAQRDKAISQAMKPINERYRTNLDALARRATQAGDLDTALLIRKELEALSGEVRTAELASAINRPSDFVDTTWEWRSGNGKELFGVLTLEQKGRVNVPSSLGFIGKWEPVSERKFKVFNKDGRYWMFEYNAGQQEAHATGEKDSFKEDKIMRLVPAKK